MSLPRLLLASLLLTAPLSAQVRLPNFLTDHMVLQRDQPVRLWGYAAPGEDVTVALASDTARTTATPLGRWSVTLPAHRAGGPFKISFAGSNTVELNDVLFGDLWLASGQSNMEMPLAGFNPQTPILNSAHEIETANYPQIRLLLIHKDASQYPLDEFKTAAQWELCTPKTVSKFSAVAYFFGRELHLNQHVPIGLIDTTWGGTPAEAWTSLDGLSHSPALRNVMESRANDMASETNVLLQKQLNAQIAAHGKPAPKNPTDYLISWEPSGLWNAMVAPLTPLPIRGVIWYQGESNASAQRASAYADLFQSMIVDWRRKWQQPAMPFLFVQLAAYANGSKEFWPILRDAQRQALALPATGMAVTIDVGEETNIHPAHKQEVGHRLALSAEAIVYGEKVVDKGPTFLRATPAGDSLRIEFDSATGLTARGGTPSGFELAGPDGVFHPATATLSGSTVTLRSTDVSNPAEARYAWTSFPSSANLYNAAGLPAGPFSTRSR